MNLLKILDGTPEPPIIDLHLEQTNRSGDYNLATPMYEFQKELTDQIVSLHYPDILKYCETNDTKELIVKSLEICINNCMLVSTHPYLLINHYMPKNLSSKDMHFKLAETSGKFNVLKDLMNVIIQSNKKHTTKNVAVVMKNESRFFDLCEALLLGCSGNKVIKRYLGHNVQRESKKANNNKNGDNSGSPTYIHLLPHDGMVQRGDDIIYDTKFDTLIVFDGYVDTNHEFIQKIRSQHHSPPTDMAVIIRLVPMKTIEHCRIYYENDKGNPDYLYKLISSIVCLREFIGNLPPDVFPIYNQKLTYLSSKFFDKLYGRRDSSGDQTFPVWPLPELPKIPKFTSIDVERSLLTEVHFHYTPYDSVDLINNEPEKPKLELKRTYYDMKRLESDYVTNPLKNDYNNLIGIHTWSNENTNVLTHRLIMQLNNAYFESEKAQMEHHSYSAFEETQEHRHGRREKSMKQSLSNILQDIDSVDTRINIGNKVIKKKLDESLNAQEEIKALTAKLSHFAADNKIEDEISKTFIQNQLDIWDLQIKIKDQLVRINSKNDEKTYMIREYENAIKSVEDSTLQISNLEEEIKDIANKIESLEDSEVLEHDRFSKQREVLLAEVRAEKLRNEGLKTKLSGTLRFLKYTSHLRKRKGRTPTTK